MRVAVSAVSRFTDPTGICKHAANIVKSLLLQNESDPITLFLGEWQTGYFNKTLGITNSDRVVIRPIAIQNRSLARNRWFVSELPKLAKQERADIIHLSFPIPILQRIRACPVVTTIHDLYPYDYPENFGFPNYYLNRLFLQMNVAQSDGFVCVSTSTMERARELFPRPFAKKKSAMIYNAADFSGVEPQRPSFVTGESEFLLTVGQHRRNKNLDILIRAFAKLRRTEHFSPELKLIIVGGSGPETDALTSLVHEEKLNSNVLFVSGLAESELAWLYAHCNLFVSSSSIEGFCMPLLEARRLSPRIVCSDIPVFRELAGTSSNLFSLAGDADSNLASAMFKSLSEQPTRSNDDFRSFSLDHIGQQYTAFYSSLLGTC